MSGSRHTGRTYHGAATYELRAIKTLRQVGATRPMRDAVYRTADDMLAVERHFAASRGTRRSTGKPVDPPARHIDAVATGRIGRLLCSAAIDLAAAKRGCHGGQERTRQVAA